MCCGHFFISGFFGPFFGSGPIRLRLRNVRPVLQCHKHSRTQAGVLMLRGSKVGSEKQRGNPSLRLQPSSHDDAGDHAAHV